jgi:transcription initiation factor TFIID subunit TAF12
MRVRNAGKLVDRLALRFLKTPRDHIASTVAEEYAALPTVVCIRPNHIPNLVEHGVPIALATRSSGRLPCRLTRDPTAAAIRTAAGAKRSITSTGTAAATTPARTAVHNYFVNSGQRSPEHSRLTTGAARL